LITWRSPPSGGIGRQARNFKFFQGRVEATKRVEKEKRGQLDPFGFPDPFGFFALVATDERRRFLVVTPTAVAHEMTTNRAHGIQWHC
jgi:hypothetical protein